jgi:S-DNA-T family DNA segregation ATPase FtsK/SpoIIIE
VLDRSRGDLVVAVAGSSDRMAATYRGLTVEARSGRCGLLLSPNSPMDGDLLDARVPLGEPRPGHGFLAVRGAVTPIQVPLP